MFRTLRSNKGSTMVIIAVMAFVMLGFTAVAVDTGNVMIQKQRLQNAVDAAALASAQMLPDSDAAEEAADRYARLNGVSPSDITATISDGGKCITIRANKNIEYTFARILGLTGQTVSLSAKAECGTLGGAFNYVLFSGSKTTELTLNGSNYSITGSTHTNQNFTANGSKNTITGACEASGTIRVNGGQTHIDNRMPGAAFVPMPDFSDMIRQQAEAAGQAYNGNKTFNGSSIDVTKPIYVNGNVTINGSKFKGVGCILATGSITFNGSSQKVSGSDSVCVYSKNGDITFNGSSAVIDGILYAPNGCVRMNGSSQTVNGRVIGNSVNLNGSGIQIIGGGDADFKCLPTKTVRLVG